VLFFWGGAFVILNLSSPPSALLAGFRCFRELPLARMGAAQAPLCLSLSFCLCIDFSALSGVLLYALPQIIFPRSLPYLLSLHESRYIRFHIQNSQQHNPRAWHKRTLLLANKYCISPCDRRETKPALSFTCSLIMVWSTERQALTGNVRRRAPSHYERATFPHPEYTVAQELSRGCWVQPELNWSPRCHHHDTIT